jgi:hypothetical protein
MRPQYLAPLNLKVIVPAFSLGYFLFSFLCAYACSSGVLHQWFGVLWQGFPHYVVFLQYLLVKLFSQFSAHQPDT